jgi:RNA polymerase sigma factor (sigma-70 family)
MSDLTALPSPSIDPARRAVSYADPRSGAGGGDPDPGSTGGVAGSRTARSVPEPAAAHAERLLHEHGPEIYRFLRRFAASPEDAADLHQDTFVRAYLALERGTAIANERAWLYRIAGNLARDAYRRREVRGSLAGALDLDALRDVGDAGAGDPHAASEAAAVRDRLGAALSNLTWRQRSAIVARVLDGDEYPEVAALLDCSEPTARQHVSQGLRKLRSILSPEWEALP